MINVSDRQQYFSCDECPILECLEHHDYCRCEDGWIDIPNTYTGRSKETDRSRRRELTKKKLKNKRESLSSYCRWGDGLSDYSNPKTAYIRRRHRSDTTTYFKRFSNRKIRREKGFLYNGNAYRRVFDYWWNVV